MKLECEIVNRGNTKGGIETQNWKLETYKLKHESL